MRPGRRTNPVSAPLPPHSPTYPWEAAYVAAILETDDARLADRISAAELAIANRMDALNMDHGGTTEEQQSLTASLASLEKLRIERLKSAHDRRFQLDQTSGR